MKMNKKLWCTIALTSSMAFSNSASANAIVDKELHDWLKESPAAELKESTKDIIVFLKTNKSFDMNSLQSIHLADEKVGNQMRLEAFAKDLRKIQGPATRVETFWASQAVALPVTRAALKLLDKDSRIEGIVLNREIYLDSNREHCSSLNNFDESNLTYGLQLVGADKVWENGIDGSGVTVGVIDSGIDDSHPDLQGKVILSKDFTNSGSAVDVLGHGTHVAGTIAGGNASGVAIGVAPGARLINARVFGNRGQTTSKILLAAMEWMIDPDGNPTTNDAPRVISNSWGASSQFVLSFRNIVWAWRENQIFPSFAAGNSGPGRMSVGAPGRYPYAFAVGAVDENMEVTSFSSRGPSVWWGKVWFKSLTKPDISAPGLKVLSSLPNGGYDCYSGTSMATPHLTGVVALMLQTNPKLTVEDTFEILMSTALDRGDDGVDNYFGSGLVQADVAVKKALTWNTNTSSSSLVKVRNQLEWVLR